MAGNNTIKRFRANETYNIAITRVYWLYPQQQREIPAERVSALNAKFKRTGIGRQHWYTFIPPIKAFISYKFGYPRICLVDGEIFYHLADALGMKVIRCTFIDKAQVLHITSQRRCSQKMSSR